MKKTVAYLFLISLLGLSLAIIWRSQGKGDIPGVLHNCRPAYLLAALLCMVLFWLLDGLIIWLIARRWGISVSLGSALRFGLVGQYYSLITPLASGAQPAQIYSMVNKGNFSIAQASSLLVEKFVIYQASVAVYAIFALCLQASAWRQSLGHNMGLVVIGLALNLIVLAGILVLVFNRMILERFILACRRVLRSVAPCWKLRKDILLREMEVFSSHLRGINDDSILLAGVTLTTFLQLTAYFSVTYFACRSLGVATNGYLQIITLQALLYMAYHYIPIPGNAGVAEGGFFYFFKMILPQESVLPGLLLWRFLVYYLNLLVSGLATLYEYLMVKNVANSP